MLKGSAVSKWIVGLGLGYVVSQVFKPKAAEQPAPRVPATPKKIYTGPGSIVKASNSYNNKVSSI